LQFFRPEEVEAAMADETSLGAAAQPAVSAEKHEKLLLLARQLKAKAKKLEAERDELQAQVELQAGALRRVQAQEAREAETLPAPALAPAPAPAALHGHPELFWGLISRAPQLQQQVCVPS
jgi:hypothetical protein